MSNDFGGLRDLYQEVIFDHNRNPRNFGELADATHHADGHNPLCGDQLTVYVQLKDGVVEKAMFVGHGCAISKASASLMLDAVIGRSRADFEHLFRDFHEVVRGGPEAQAAQARLGKLAAFSGIWKYPSRVKCAILCWHAVRSALAGEARASTEEGAPA